MKGSQLIYKKKLKDFKTVKGGEKEMEGKQNVSANISAICVSVINRPQRMSVDGVHMN